MSTHLLQIKDKKLKDLEKMYDRLVENAEKWIDELYKTRRDRQKLLDIAPCQDTLRDCKTLQFKDKCWVCRMKIEK